MSLLKTYFRNTSHCSPDIQKSKWKPSN